MALPEHLRETGNSSLDWTEQESALLTYVMWESPSYKYNLIPKIYVGNSGLRILADLRAAKWGMTFMPNDSTMPKRKTKHEAFQNIQIWAAAIEEFMTTIYPLYQYVTPLFALEGTTHLTMLKQRLRLMGEDQNIIQSLERESGYWHQVKLPNLQQAMAENRVPLFTYAAKRGRALAGNVTMRRPF